MLRISPDNVSITPSRELTVDHTQKAYGESSQSKLITTSGEHLNVTNVTSGLGETIKKTENNSASDLTASTVSQPSRPSPPTPLVNTAKIVPTTPKTICDKTCKTKKPLSTVCKSFKIGSLLGMLEIEWLSPPQACEPETLEIQFKEQMASHGNLTLSYVNGLNTSMAGKDGIKGKLTESDKNEIIGEVSRLVTDAFQSIANVAEPCGIDIKIREPIKNPLLQVSDKLEVIGEVKIYFKLNEVNYGSYLALHLGPGTRLSECEKKQ